MPQAILLRACRSNVFATISSGGKVLRLCATEIGLSQMDAAAWPITTDVLSLFRELQHSSRAMLEKESTHDFL